MTPPPSGLSPFHVAALEGNLRVLQILAAFGKSEISRADSVEGRTCLHWAAVHRHYDVIKFLIQDGHVDIHHVDVFGHTADQIHSDLVIIYLIHGTFPHDDHHDSANNIGTPPASHSKSYAPLPPAATAPLPPAATTAQTDEAKLAASAERSLSIINSKDAAGKTEKPAVGKLNVKDNWIKNSEKESDQQNHRPADQAAGEGPHASAPAAHEANGSAATTDAIAMTPEKILKLFDWVAVDNKIADLESSLGVTPEIKVDVNSIKHPETGESLLHTACRKGHLAVAQFLVEGVGSDVNSVDANGATPLHDAVVGSSVLIVRYLVKYCGAMLDVRNTAGQTALEISQGMEPTDDDQEIARIISKAIGKSPEKRTKIDLPVYQPK
jgi:ankyrin repeat protein